MVVAILLFALQAEPHPLSKQLRTLEKDLTSADYRAVLGTMIRTDLAAEWQRVATPDNYHRFAQRHGGLDAIEKDPALKKAYDRRKRIADGYLNLMRAEYARVKRKPPFEKEAELLKVLESADRRAGETERPAVEIRPIIPVEGGENQWPAFRGPTGRGIVIDARIPMQWSATENVIWKSPLPGRGNSSPIIWKNKLFVTAESPRAADEKDPDRVLLCFDRTTGRLIWKHAAPRPKALERLYWKNTYASSTPVTDGKYVIVFFGNSGLLCCDFEGRRVWHRDLGLFPTTHGPGATPVLYDGRVILIQDQTRGKSLCAAFEVGTGAPLWTRERGKGMCWNTPVLLRVGGRDELIYNGSNEITSYDPGSGKTLWTMSGTSREAIPMIAAGGGLLYSTSGRNGPTFAIRPGGRGDITKSHVVWRNERGGPHVPSPAYHGGRLYLVNDMGILTCLDAGTGERLYQERLRGKFSMSPLVIGDLLLLLNEAGVAYLVKSSATFELLGRNDLGEETLATPAVVGGRIYFRTAKHVVCVGRAE